MQKVKISRWDYSSVGIISGKKSLAPGNTPVLAKTAADGSAQPVKWRMNQLWKKIFFLDFEKSFFSSCAKLLFVWNPLWTLLVSFVLSNWTLSLFRWGWNFFEASCAVLIGLVLVKAYLFAERAWAQWSAKNLPRHGLAWHLLFVAFVAPLGVYIADHLILVFINSIYPGEPIPFEFHWRFYGTEISWIWSLFLVCFLFFSFLDLRDAARLSQIRAEELEKERLQAALDKLKDQMNPHFLFNTLNTVAALIPADPGKAEEVVVKLSTLFQAVLEATRESNHSLVKELEFCRTYLDIEKARFGPRLSSSIEIGQGLDPAQVLVPVLLLQPLVENAVKHGLSSRAAGGRIWIRAVLAGGRLELVVEDDGVGFGNSPYAGSGTALENCRKRLELGFGKEGRLEITLRPGGGTKIGLSMPLLAANGNE